MTPAAWLEAQHEADRFDRDKQRGGMTEVISDIQQCYSRTTRPRVDQQALRQCLVFDYFTVRFNAETERQMPGLGNLPFYQQNAVQERLGRYGPLAGFRDPAVLGGYIAQGSKSIFSALAARTKG